MSINPSHFIAFSNPNKCLKIWKISSNSTALIKDYKGAAFDQLIGEEIKAGDRVKINWAKQDGTVILTIYSARVTKADIFKIDLQ